MREKSEKINNMKESKSYNAVRKYTVIPLKELLPLALPLSMFIDPVNLCNFRCKSSYN